MPPPPKRPTKRIGLIVGVVLLVLLLSGGNVFALLVSSSTRNGVSAGTQSTTAQAHTSATTGVGMTGMPASSPSASTPSHLTYRGHASDVHAVAWSPNGTRIASGSADSTVQVWKWGEREPSSQKQSVTSCCVLHYLSFVRPLCVLQHARKDAVLSAITLYRKSVREFIVVVLFFMYTTL